METTSDIKLGLAGAGVIGQRHIKAVSAISGIDVVAIADPNSSGKAVADKLGVPGFDNTESMVEQAKLDGVIVATPTEHHLGPTLAALGRGYPVLVEKPVMSTEAEAEETIAAAENNDAPVLVGHHRRYYGLVNRAREIIQSGEIGSLVNICGQWSVRKHEDYYQPEWRKQWQAGPILTNMIHEMDLLRFLCGDIESISAETSNAVQGFDKEDAAAIVLRFKNGAIGSFVISDQTPSPWSWESATGENLAFPKSGQNVMRLMGTKGALEFPNLILWKHAKSPRDWHHGMQSHRRDVTLEDAFVAQIQHFVEVIRGDASPRISARDATDTLRATLAVYRAASSGRRVVL